MIKMITLRELSRDLSCNAMRSVAIASLLAIMLSFSAQTAFALSEIQQEDVPLPEASDENENIIERRELPAPTNGESERPQQSLSPAPSEDDDGMMPPRSTMGMPVPLPDPIVAPRHGTQSTNMDSTEEEANDPDPEVLYDLTLLPEPVLRMRKLIMEAAMSGDIERLRPLISGGENGTMLSFGGGINDPVQFLREISGDDQGHEILAILYEVLDAGYVRLDEGSPEEMYVWPYFFAVSLENLTARQRVELFTLVTAGDYEDMKNYGGYIFYRVGISPEGRWLFFVAGD